MVKSKKLRVDFRVRRRLRARVVMSFKSIKSEFFSHTFVCDASRNTATAQSSLCTAESSFSSPSESTHATNSLLLVASTTLSVVSHLGAGVREDIGR